ncbi:MAG: alpha/beta hydrolase [Ramlibacter sp.]|nr:alpha/beta hydrolase [Ramlibacter sp.]
MTSETPLSTPLIEDFRFVADDHQLAATRLRPGAGMVRVLTLHGLGATATRHTVRYVLDDLAAHGHGALCFEFSGNGDSTGMLEQSCLRRRCDEALAAAAQLDAGRRPVLIGTSMGAHLAASIVPALRPAGLVLFCPAAYPAHATDMPFDAHLPRPGRHADSPAYAGLSDFEGDLLIIGARNDSVVPGETLEGYLDNAPRARSHRLIWLEGCDHFIHRWLPHQGAIKDEVLTSIRRVVSAATLAH